ncbi:MAG: acetate kinase, partial [Bacteroidetes bacterium]
AAIKNGESVDTSMGLTPNEGLLMGTRTGDVDAGAMLFVQSKEKLDLNETNTLINKKSGVLGISGISPDMRELEQAAEEGNHRAQLALDMFHYRIRKYIGAYAAAMGGVDIIILTGGIGENGDLSRAAICKGFEYLGLDLDKEKNKGIRGVEAVISKNNSKVTAVIIPTDEEIAIAEDTFRIVQ